MERVMSQQLNYRLHDKEKPVLHPRKIDFHAEETKAQIPRDGNKPELTDE